MDDGELQARLQTALGDAFVVAGLVGHGGCAVVFSARDRRLERDIAVKVLRPELDSPITRERFRREAESVARLRHPHVIAVHDIGEANGITWFTMPLIKGESLRARLDREGKLDVAETQRILTEAARALEAAHMEGLIHRDIKPDNILLDGNERRVVLMDFGLVKSLGLDDSGLTTNGMVVGTPHFMSPEQLAGDAPVDVRTDIFALGVVGYRMLAGVLPFEAKTVPMLVAKVLGEEPTPIHWRRPDTPPPLAEAVMRCLAKVPEERWASAAEFEQALTTTMAPRPAARRSTRRSSAVSVAQVQVAEETPWIGLPAMSGDRAKARGAMKLSGWRSYFARVFGWWTLGTAIWMVVEWMTTHRVRYSPLVMIGFVAHGASVYAKAWMRGYGWRELLGLRAPPVSARGPAGRRDMMAQIEEDEAVADGPADQMLDAMRTDRRIIVALLLRTARADLDRATDPRRTVDDAIAESEAAAERVFALDDEIAYAAGGRRSSGRRLSLGRPRQSAGRPLAPTPEDMRRVISLEAQRDDVLHAMRQSSEAVQALRLRLQHEGVPGSEAYIEVVSGATQRLRMREQEAEGAGV